MDYSIVPATISHVHKLSRVMRKADAREVRSIGYDPRFALRMSFRSSLYARTAFIGEDIAAMWGVTGDILSNVGTPWLVTAPIIESKPLSFVREVKREVATMLTIKPRLENYVIADYRGAVWLLEKAGFYLDPPAPYGRHGILFRHFWIEA